MNKIQKCILLISLIIVGIVLYSTQQELNNISYTSVHFNLYQTPSERIAEERLYTEQQIKRAQEIRFKSFNYLFYIALLTGGLIFITKGKDKASEKSRDVDVSKSFVKLKELYEEGILSEEEYNKKKQMILDKYLQG